MKKQFVSMAVIAGLAFGVVACSNSGTDSAANDTSTTGTTTSTTTDMTTATSTGSYAAMADSVERNSQQGYYLNPQTGKPYSSLRVDRTSGQVTNEAGEPVWRYVDNRNWSVYGYDDRSSNWNQMGEARMEGSRLQYKGDNDQWTSYENRWKTEDERMAKEWKLKTDNMKIKKDEDGETKIKTDDVKIKKDEDGEMKIKTDDKKIKVDEDGKVKQKDN